MNRFFKRLGEGKYDLEDLEYRTNRLISFLKEASERYSFDLSKQYLLDFQMVQTSQSA